MVKNIPLFRHEATVILFMVISKMFCQDQVVLTEAAKKLTELLRIDLPPKGEPFPKIKGPTPLDYVCIAGAGPAGVHMAISLKDRGYKNIKIFEKSARVGGKSYDTQLQGFYRPQGTAYLSADYFDNIVELAKRYGVGELREINKPGVCT